MQGLVIGAIVFALCVAIFASQNALPVEIQLIFWTVKTPLVVIVIVASALGAILMGLPSWLKQFMTGVKLRKLNIQYQDLKKEMTQLEERLNIPLDASSPDKTVGDSTFSFFDEANEPSPTSNNEVNNIPPTE